LADVGERGSAIAATAEVEHQVPRATGLCAADRGGRGRKRAAGARRCGRGVNTLAPGAGCSPSVAARSRCRRSPAPTEVGELSPVLAAADEVGTVARRGGGLRAGARRGPWCSIVVAPRDLNVLALAVGPSRARRSAIRCQEAGRRIGSARGREC